MTRIQLAWLIVPSLVIQNGRDAKAEDPFASRVVDYSPAPGQFVRNELLNDPVASLGPPLGGGTSVGNNSSVVTLGGFGGSLTLAFDQTVLDDPRNPFGMDAIVFGNAFGVGGNADRRWAECAHIEISRDANGNGQADDAWFLIPGTHLDHPPEQHRVQSWDDDFEDPTFPPDNPNHWPVGVTGVLESAAYELPASLFGGPVVENPNGPTSPVEGIYGYADFSSTLLLGDLDGDNIVDDPDASPQDFYTFPDDPLSVGVWPGSGGGDAFDIAWAIDPQTLAPAELVGFDFIRITSAVHRINAFFGENSAEVDAVSDVTPGRSGDADFDRDVDMDDFNRMIQCVKMETSAVDADCAIFDFDEDNTLTLLDFGAFQAAFTGADP